MKIEIEPIAQKISDGLFGFFDPNETGDTSCANQARKCARAIAPLIAKQVMPQWEPIETAPKNGDVILVYANGRRIIAWWNYFQFDKHNNGWDFSGNGFINPTHWMPLPPAPDAILSEPIEVE